MEKVPCILLLGMILVSLTSATIDNTREGIIDYTTGDSMKPTINHLQIVEVTENISNLKEGDIVIFSSEVYLNLLWMKLKIANYQGYLHRIVEIGEDEDGWFAKTKGDNNFFKDLGKRRHEDILFKITEITDKYFDEGGLE